MNMKKIIKYILAVSLMLGMVVTMTACGKKDKDTKQYGKDNETILNENKAERHIRGRPCNKIKVSSLKKVLDFQ